MITSSSSGTLKIGNLNYMNKLYEMMKVAVFYDSEQNRISYPHLNNNIGSIMPPSSVKHSNSGIYISHKNLAGNANNSNNNIQ